LLFVVVFQRFFPILEGFPRLPPQFRVTVGPVEQFMAREAFKNHPPIPPELSWPKVFSIPGISSLFLRFYLLTTILTSFF